MQYATVSLREVLNFIIIFLINSAVMTHCIFMFYNSYGLHKFTGTAVYSSELVLNGIVIQKLELERYIFPSYFCSFLSATLHAQGIFFLLYSFNLV